MISFCTPDLSPHSLCSSNFPNPRPPQDLSTCCAFFPRLRLPLAVSSLSFESQLNCHFLRGPSPDYSEVAFFRPHWSFPLFFMAMNTL